MRLRWLSRLAGCNDYAASRRGKVLDDLYSRRQGQSALGGALAGRANLDDETETEHTREPLKHLERGIMLSQFESSDVRLSDAQLLSELRLR
jgi:hypothetical protein